MPFLAAPDSLFRGKMLAMAAPGLARQLVEVVDYLTERAREPDALDDLIRRREARLLTRGLRCRPSAALG